MVELYRTKVGGKGWIIPLWTQQKTMSLEALEGMRMIY